MMKKPQRSVIISAYETSQLDSSWGAGGAGVWTSRFLGTNSSFSCLFLSLLNPMGSRRFSDHAFAWHQERVQSFAHRHGVDLMLEHDRAFDDHPSKRHFLMRALSEVLRDGKKNQV